jgi:hypothetical protein
LTIDFGAVKFHIVRDVLGKTPVSVVNRSTNFSREYKDESESMDYAGLGSSGNLHVRL